MSLGATRMGFSFRRSSSFGPFRLNFSKSGIGASVGVKGARVTLTPRGRTYITVGAGGFYYRQNLNVGQHSVPSPQPVEPAVHQQFSDEIKTADVEQLREISKSELVEDLNRRAAMFNPAVLLFVLAGTVGLVGIVTLTSSLPSTLPALPEVGTSFDSSRQANTLDDYALLVARYGQPSTVQIMQAGTAPVRDATWHGANLIVRSVPIGCVDAFNYFEAHKGDPAPVHAFGRKRNGLHTEAASVPTCNSGVSTASTIVGYEDSLSHSAVDSLAAGGALGAMGTRSSVPPTVTVSAPPSPKKHAAKVEATSQTVSYDEATTRAEIQRLRDLDSSAQRSRRTGWGCLAGVIVLLVPAFLVHRKNKEKRTTELIYDLSKAAVARQGSMESSLGHLAQTGAIWRLDSQSAVTDWKRNAGAAYNVERERVSMSRTTPPRVQSNVIPLCLDLGKLRLYFLPDQILYWQRGTFASIEYRDLQVASTSTRFIEESVQTSDSRQVDSTWRYVRKDGGPDRRFNNNRQLPVMLYGVVHITSNSGVNLVFHTSRSDAASSFQTTFRGFQLDHQRLVLSGEATNREVQTEWQADPTSAIPKDVVEAMTLLGMKPGCTNDEVVAAYRHMAQMYHPDKTMGLGPELRLLAERRMKEVNSAHQTVKLFLGQHGDRGE